MSAHWHLAWPPFFTRGSHSCAVAVSQMNPTPPTVVGTRPVVAVLNSADDVIEMLRVALEGSGFAVVSAKLSEIQSGVMDLVAFVREAGFLNRLGWVLTTLDKAALEAAVGPAPVVQIVLGKPYGLDDVVAAVRQSLSQDGHAQDGHLQDRHPAK